VSRYAIALARFYEELAERLLAGARAAFAEDGEHELEVFDVPLFPPPHAITEAARVNVPRTARIRRALTQTFRKCIDFS